MPIAHFMSLRSLWSKVTASHSDNEDSARREFILNTLLAGTVLLLCVGVVASAHNFLFSDPIYYEHSALSLATLVLLLAFFCFLHFLSRAGFVYSASFLLIGAFLSLAVYMGLEWGADVNASLLFYALVVVMSGIVINTRFAFFVAVFVAITIPVMSYLQTHRLLEVNAYWRSEPWNVTDSIVAGVIFLIIATVSWLGNREISRSLARARASEAALTKERDLLEEKVEERTRALKETQAEQMAQLYRFAEFGKLSAGLFHDLVSPLTALSIGMERLRRGNDALRRNADQIGRTIGTGPVSESVELVEHVVRSMRRLESMVTSVQRQLSRTERHEVFLASSEIRDIVDMLAHRARTARVALRYHAVVPEPVLTGDPMQFAQIVLNLVSNAIDACADVPEGQPRSVLVEFTDVDTMLQLRVIDSGCGIPAHHHARIFEPFFSTKEQGRGLGLGLSLARRLVEKKFGGTIAVESAPYQGTTFTVYLPKRRP